MHATDDAFVPCPHTWFIHGSPAWEDGLKVLSSLLVLSTMGKYKEAIKSIDIGRLKTQSLTLKTVKKNNNNKKPGRDIVYLIQRHLNLAPTLIPALGTSLR